MTYLEALEIVTAIAEYKVWSLEKKYGTHYESDRMAIAKVEAVIEKGKLIIEKA